MIFEVGIFLSRLVLSTINNRSFRGLIVFVSISTSWILVLLSLRHVVSFWSMTKNISKILMVETFFGFTLDTLMLTLLSRFSIVLIRTWYVHHRWFPLLGLRNRISNYWVLKILDLSSRYLINEICRIGQHMIKYLNYSFLRGYISNYLL